MSCWWATAAARQRLEQLARQLGATNVHFLPLQPRADLPAMLASAAVLALVQRVEVVDSVAPSKLLMYMAAGRPIIAAVSNASEVARHLRAADCGQVVASGDSIALARAILAGCDRQDAVQRWSANARRYAEQHFARTTVLHRYGELFSALVTRSTGRPDPWARSPGIETRGTAAPALPHSGPDMTAIPLDGTAQSLTKLSSPLEAEPIARARDIKAPARLSVRLACIHAMCL